MAINQKNRTKKNRLNKTKTKKYRRKTMRAGGFFGSLFSSNQPAPANTLIQKSNDATTNTKKSILGMSTAENTKLAATTANIALVGTTASNIGYGTVAGLTASGVGIPLAGAIAGALLIANKLSNMYLTKLKLKTIMLDAMSILTNCYKLNELIEKAYQIIQTHLKKLNKGTHELVSQIGIDSEIKTHIFNKVNDVTVYLLKITKDSLLEMLLNDEDIKRSGFIGPVKTEYDLRKENKVNNFFNKAQRGITRFIYASDTKSDIIDNLSLINSFFIIIKSQYDFALQLYERELVTEWANILKEIESSDEYKNYLIPVQNLSQYANNIIKNETNEMKTAAWVVKKDVQNKYKESKEEKSENENSENENSENENSEFHNVVAKIDA